MKVNDAIDIIRNKLTSNRFEHTMRVYEEAVKIAKIFNGPIQQVELAAILHDYSKNDSEDDLRQAIINDDLPENLLHFNKELWHGPVAAIKVREKFNIKDNAIIDAIYYHTSARANMGMVEKIIYVADYIEPQRNFPGLDEVRELATTDLDKAVFHTLRNTIIYLMKKNEKIYPDSFYAYNYYISV